MFILTIIKNCLWEILTPQVRLTLNYARCDPRELHSRPVKRDLLRLVPQITPQLLLPVSFCVPSTAPQSWVICGQGNVVASSAVHPCSVKGWTPRHQEYSNRVQIITSQGIPALGRRLKFCVLFQCLESIDFFITGLGINWSESSVGSIPFLAVWLDHSHVPNLSELSCLNYLLLCNLPNCSCPEEPRKCYRSKGFENLLFFIAMLGRIVLLLLLFLPSEDDCMTQAKTTKQPSLLRREGLEPEKDLGWRSHTLNQHFSPRTVIPSVSFLLISGPSEWPFRSISGTLWTLTFFLMSNQGFNP